MIDTPKALYFEGKQRGQVVGYALAVIELAGTFRAPHTARKMWRASGFTLEQAISGGLASRDVATLRHLAPPEPPEAPLLWSQSPSSLCFGDGVASVEHHNAD